jgi:hypothetical protein
MHASDARRGARVTPCPWPCACKGRDTLARSPRHSAYVALYRWRQRAVQGDSGLALIMLTSAVRSGAQGVSVLATRNPITTASNPGVSRLFNCVAVKVLCKPAPSLAIVPSLGDQHVVGWPHANETAIHRAVASATLSPQRGYCGTHRGSLGRGST